MGITVLDNGTSVYNATNIIAKSEEFTIVNSSATTTGATTTSATVVSTPSTSSLSPVPAARPPSSSLSAGAKAGIGIGAALGAIIALALLWLLYIHKRKHKNDIPELLVPGTVARKESTTYRKPELEGDHGENSFHYPGKPELAVAETSTNPTSSNVALEETTQHLPSSITPEATEKELVNPDQPISRIQSPERLPQVPVPQTEDTVPKYAVTDDLEIMRAQERQMASEIDAHESLQRLRHEHAALLQRIKEAEERIAPKG